MDLSDRDRKNIKYYLINILSKNNNIIKPKIIKIITEWQVDSCEGTPTANTLCCVNVTCKCYL